MIDDNFVNNTSCDCRWQTASHKKQEGAAKMRICAVGDVAPRRDDPASIFAATAASLRAADVCFGQMECPISLSGTPAPGARLAMRTTPDVGPALKAAGFACMSVAGNHALDFGAEALADTLDHLGNAGIAISGAGPNLAAARAPAVITTGGKRVALIARSSILPAGYAADASRPGCAPMRAHTHYEQIEHDQPGTPPRILTFADQGDLAALCADIAAAREAADVVLVSLHWGIHFVRASVADYQREVARAVIAAGADAVLGHHPHLLKGVEFIAGKPVFYSLGNFAIEQPAAFDEAIREHASFAHLQTLSDGWQPQAKYQTPPETRHSVIAWLDFAEGSPDVSLQPCRIDDDSVPHPLLPGSAEWDDWLEYVTAITAEAGLNAAYVPRADGLVTCREAPPAG
jgi:poly-gamma-glutamate capsule biosynthesis protein CapA/YwtB (metallophosphatase superfamily)